MSKAGVFYVELGEDDHDYTLVLYGERMAMVWGLSTLSSL